MTSRDFIITYTKLVLKTPPMERQGLILEWERKLDELRSSGTESGNGW